jgi:hypothetical protein
LQSDVKKEIKELLKSKQAGVKLETLLERYTLKIKKDQMSKLSLRDSAEIKKQLKDNIYREVQGLRSSGSDFNLLSKVDKHDLMRMVHDIKKELKN